MATTKKTASKAIAPKIAVSKKSAPKLVVAIKDVAAKDIKSKKFVGTVVGDKMDKTIVVKTESVRIHEKYHKRYVISKKYKVHDEKNQYKIGDSVVFVSCRPMSKDKKWRVLYA